MANTLDPLITEYVRARKARGEITGQTGIDIDYTLRGFSKSFGQRPIRQLGPAAIDRYLEQIGQLAPATRREYLSRVRRFTRWLLAQGKITNDPTAHVERIRQPKRQPVTFTPEEIGKLFCAVEGDRRAEAMLALFIGCGPRCVEIARLQVNDYDPGKATIHFIGKALDERTVPVPAEAAAALDVYLDEVGRRGGPLFRSHLNPAVGLEAKTISGYFRRWAIAAGVKTAPLDGRSAHGMRRTAGSDVMDQTENVQLVQEMLGHVDINTTADAYLRAVPMDRMRDGMEGRTYRPTPAVPVSPLRVAA